MPVNRRQLALPASGRKKTARKSSGVTKWLRAERARLGSWGKLADELGIGKGACWNMAHGRQPASIPVMAAYLRHKVLRGSAFRRFLRKVAVPFLASRQRSKSGRYGRGGRPL